MRQWERHADPLFQTYNVPRLTPEQQETFWRYWTGKPGTVSLAGEFEGRFIAHILLRDLDPEAKTADLGISLDPAYVGQGLGTELLRLTQRFALQSFGLNQLTLDVFAYNRRALRAYLSAGFEEIDRRWIQSETPVDFRALLQMPENAWMREFVRIDSGYMMVLVRMSAQTKKAL